MFAFLERPLLVKAVESVVNKSDTDYRKQPINTRFTQPKIFQQILDQNTISPLLTKFSHLIIRQFGFPSS
jgi:hypothetical protein